MYKKILILSSSRADYFLLYTLYQRLKKEFNVYFLEHGSEIFLTMNRVLNRLLSDLPDLAIILGDRSETLAAAIQLHLHRIPIAHLHGGEITLGACDDAFRNAITQLSQIHFTSTENHKNRVLAMGKKNVYNVGALGVENVLNSKIYTKKYIEDKLHFKFKDKNILVTYHPETLKGNAKEDIDAILKILDRFDMQKLFTRSNSDIGGDEINRAIEEFCREGKGILLPDLGKLYFSVIRQCNGVVGNSSSGIIEVPSLGIWVINIGNRQKGRTKSKSIINCKIEDLVFAIPKLFKKIPKNKNPYDNGNTSEKIARILKRR